MEVELCVELLPIVLQWLKILCKLIFDSFLCTSLLMLGADVEYRLCSRCPFDLGLPLICFWNFIFKMRALLLGAF